mgnify:CR=1 FL=1
MSSIDAAGPVQFPPRSTAAVPSGAARGTVGADAATTVAAEPTSSTSGGAPAKSSAGPSRTVMDELRESLDAANKRLELSDQQIKLTVDQDTGAIVVTVTDRRTGDTVRQIPSEDALKLRQRLDSLTGILVDRKS